MNPKIRMKMEIQPQKLKNYNPKAESKIRNKKNKRQEKTLMSRRWKNTQIVDLK